MITTIIISLIAILFAWLARFQKSKYGGLELAFILLAVFMSIRYDFGNDYSSYLNKFLRIGAYSNFDLSAEKTEIGWSFLNLLFQPIGFFGMVIVLTVFEYVVIYRLIKKYVPKQWYWLSVFTFTLNNGYMLVFGSMMRQFLAMCIFIIAVEFIINKKWVTSILLVLLASLFHVSALILLPFCFLGYFEITLTKKLALMWFGVYLLLSFVAVGLLGDYFFSLIELDQFEKYQAYVGVEKDSFSTGLGVIFNMIMYLFLLFHQKYQSEKIKLIFILFALSFFFNVFADIAPLSTRLGYYFLVFSIACYPLMFKTMKGNIWKYPLLFGYITITIKGFVDFFDSTGIWYDSFYTYQTIFSVTSWM